MAKNKETADARISAGKSVKEAGFHAVWDQRIGSHAADTLCSAYQFVPHFFISAGTAFIVALMAMATDPQPLWLSILISVASLTWVFFAFLTLWTNSSRRKRAARQVFEYLGRPAQCRRSTFPTVMLQNSQRFDNYLVMKGIPQAGNYKSGAVPKAYTIASKRRSSSLRN